MAIDVREMVTKRIIEELEKGIIPWHKPWSGVRDGAFNRVSKKPYSLLNQMLLKHSGEYATFDQWKKLGGKIRKGEKSEFVCFWKVYQKEVEENGETKTKTIPILRYYNVFHISQVDGVEKLKDEELNFDIASDEVADAIIKDYVSRSGIFYKEKKSNKAYYSPITDEVVVPLREQYTECEEFYSTTFHELTHSTGHKSRLNRICEVANFGSETYSKEELVAELGSAFILNYLGMETPSTFKNSASYIQGWLAQLKKDKNLIISAASKAEKATNLILGKDVEK